MYTVRERQKNEEEKSKGVWEDAYKASYAFVVIAVMAAHFCVLWLFKKKKEDSMR